jgi:hypothetical protein
MTTESAVIDLTAATNALLVAVNVSKATLDASVAEAVEFAATSSLGAGTATTKAL